MGNRFLQAPKAINSMHRPISIIVITIICDVNKLLLQELRAHLHRGGNLKSRKAITLFKFCHSAILLNIYKTEHIYTNSYFTRNFKLINRLNFVTYFI